MPIYQLSPGDVFDGKYRVEEQLGQGGMAIVYRVIEIGEVATEHALKLIRLPSFPSQEALAVAKERFRQEAATQARVRHPHVVGVHRYDVANDGTPYLLMELLDGEDLGVVLKRVSRLPWASALTVLEQTALALSALHKSGLVHRDLSPGNIFLVQHGSASPETVIFVKLLDFGIAKRGTEALDGASASLTNPSLRIGNPPYMAPECILRKPRKKIPPAETPTLPSAEPAAALEQDHEIFDSRADEFSLASIFFEMVTGRKAFLPAGADPTQAFGLVLTADPLAGELPAAFVPEVRRVLNRAFSKDPDARYDTVMEFVAALRSASQSRTSGSSDPQTGDDRDEAARRTLLLKAAAPVPPTGPALSPRFIVLAALVTVVALLCISVYDEQIREFLEHLGVPKARPVVGTITMPGPPTGATRDMALPGGTAETPRDGGAFDGGLPDVVLAKAEGGQPATPAAGSHSGKKTKGPASNAHPLVHVPGVNKHLVLSATKYGLRFVYLHADALQKDRAAPALEVFQSVISYCLKQKQNWSEIEIIAMTRLHASGLSSGSANQDFSSCLNAQMVASAVIPKRTVVTRVK